MAETNLIANIDQYVIVNKRILKLVGLHPVHLTRYAVCILSMLLIVVPQVFQIYMSTNDFSLILETSSVLSTILLAIFKSLIWLWNSETQKIVSFMMTDYWQIAEAFDENNRMEGYAKSGRYVTRGYCFLIANSLFIFFTLRPIKSIVSTLCGRDSSEKKSFPFPAIYPESFYESPLYEITYVSQMVATGICALVILAMDTLIATALFHTAGHFNILRENLLNLDFYCNQIERLEKIQYKAMESTENIINTENSTINFRKRMRSLISHHQLVLRFSDDMEDAFNPIMLMQVLASSLIICLVGFEITTTMSEVGKLVEYFSYLLMALFQVLLFCWPGDEIIFQSSMVANAAFSMTWYKAPDQIKTAVSLIILRSQKPSCLTAGKFYIMCMESFSVILSTSMSYFTLVRSANFN